MGGTACKCNHNGAEPEQEKFSRNRDQAYEFPHSGNADAGPKDLGVSALTPKNGVPPLALPLKEGKENGAGEDRGGLSADAAAGRGGFLPMEDSIPEHEPLEIRGDQFLPDLKEALSSLAEPPDQALPAGTAADAAAGRPLDLDTQNEAAAEPSDAPPPDAAVANENAEVADQMVYRGAAADAAAAAEVTAMRKASSGKSDHKKDATPENWEAGGEISAPAAADLANRGDRNADSMIAQAGSESRPFHELGDIAEEATEDLDDDRCPLLDSLGDDRGPEVHDEKKPSSQLGEMPIVEVTSSTAPPDNASALGCFQLAESSSCAGCPLLTMDRQEQFSRDGHRTQSEHYDHVGVSAFTIPENEQAGAQHNFLLSRNDSESQGAPPPPGGDSRASQDGPTPLEASRENADGESGAAAKSIAEEPGNVAEARDAEAEEPTTGEAAPEQDLGLNGEWLNEGQLNIVDGLRIHFASGETYDLQPTSDTTCQMKLDGVVYYGRLATDRNRLMWSDGDVWIRKEAPASQKADGPRSAAAAPEDGAKPSEPAAAERDSKSREDPADKQADAPAQDGEKAPEGAAGKKKSKEKDKEKEAPADDPPEKPAKKKGCCVIS